MADEELQQRGPAKYVEGVVDMRSGRSSPLAIPRVIGAAARARR